MEKWARFVYLDIDHKVLVCHNNDARCHWGFRVIDEPVIIYVARDADGSLNTWSEEPEYIDKGWKPAYWYTDACEPGTIDEVEFMDLQAGDIAMFELRRIK